MMQVRARFLMSALCAALSVWHEPASALSIDNMILVSGQNSKGDFLTLNNNSESPVFVKTELSSLTTDNGKSHETRYTKDNLMQWGITLDPSLFILDPGESRQVALRVLTDPGRLRDEVYGVSFIPQANQPDASKGEQQMNIQVGFKAYYIVPAKESKMDYRVRYNPQNGELTLTNLGNTLLQAQLNQCRAGVKKDPEKPCSTMFLVIAGKERTFTVPEWLRGEKMPLEVMNHSKRYRQPVTLTAQQSTYSYSAQLEKK